MNGQHAGSGSALPPLSVLDTVPVGPGIDLSAALDGSLCLARTADSLGFRRLWIAEHHASADSGCGTPAVLIARVASVATRMRVGAGGVMLPNHAPLVVAEEFRMLAALYPDRIDLGLGRAKAVDDALVPLLRRADADYGAYSSQIRELQTCLSGRIPGHHANGSTRMPPVAPPPLYILGSGAGSATLAGALGLPFAYAHFQNPAGTANAISSYRSAFVPSDACAVPFVILSVRVVGRTSESEASTAAVTASAIRLRQTAADRSDLDVAVAVLQDTSLTDLEHRLAQSHLAQSSVFVGNPQCLAASLSPLTREVQPDELMALPFESDPAGRIDTIGALAAATNHVPRFSAPLPSQRRRPSELK
ncbi:MsnO8 family LLM class oxidoreductase [Nocardia sp. NPDC059691]|uniref:MsnO8 family LLM class oxidoreductase n=1 Tax=Nocardia sp. NPDC059691 TaxID=3346908 RepID=UPI00367E52CC